MIRTEIDITGQMFAWPIIQPNEQMFQRTNVATFVQPYIQTCKQTDN